MWKKRLVFVLWCLLGTATIVLCAIAMHEKDNQSCPDVVVEIKGNDDHLFVDEKEILTFLKANTNIINHRIGSISLRMLEESLEKNPWIQQADLFFDNNKVLHVDIVEREPLARIFSVQGTSFYIDSLGVRLPLSNKLTARVPFFTSFPSDKKVLSAPDSTVLKDVMIIAGAITKDSFWLAQTAQVDISGHRTYEIIPVIGNQVIELGTADSIQKKLSNLYAFYKTVFAKTGFEKYERINAQYEGQIIATRKNAANIGMDSLKAMRILNNTNSLHVSDTLAASIPVSIVKNAPAPTVPAIVAPPVAEKTNEVKKEQSKDLHKAKVTVTKQPVVKAVQTLQPKAVMPKKL